MLTCDWLKQPLHAEMNNLVGFYFIQLGLLETIFAVVIVLSGRLHFLFSFLFQHVYSVMKE